MILKLNGCLLEKNKNNAVKKLQHTDNQGRLLCVRQL